MFNVLLIVRAPLQLFQAIQTSILPHLAGLEARESAEEFHRAIRLTILVIAAFAGAVALGLLAIGPSVMTALLGNKGFHYGRVGLAVVGLGMGLHLIAGHAEPGRAGPRARAPGRGRLAGRRGAVRGVRRRADDQRRGDAGRGRLLRAPTLVLCGLLLAGLPARARRRSRRRPVARAELAPACRDAQARRERLAGRLLLGRRLESGLLSPLEAGADVAHRRAHRRCRAPSPRS